MSHDSEYDRLINNKWKAAGLSIPTQQQAERGCRQLYRKAMGKSWKGEVKTATGNRYTWVRYGVLIVNPNRPDYWGRTGWPDMVHMISHYCHRRLRPHERPHSVNQLELEKELTNYALSDAFAKYRN